MRWSSSSKEIVSCEEEHLAAAHLTVYLFSAGCEKAESRVTSYKNQFDRN